MVIVVLEGQDGALKRVSLEAVTAARQLAAASGIKTAALANGAGAQTLSEAAAPYVNEALYCESDGLASYATGAYAGAVARAAEELSASFVLFAATAQGKDLAPRVAMRLRAALATDVTGIATEGANVVLRRPVFAGKATADVVSKAAITCASLRPNAFAAAEPSGAGASVRALDVAISADDLRAKVTAFTQSAGAAKELTEADIVVSGGRGLKDPSNWHIIEELADVLGAAVGASRAVVDAGWRPHHEQVGQTGKVVAPALYIACGISGAIQHLAGMSSSKCIVAINRDADAPIFKIADYGIVGDALEVVPALTSALKALKQA